MIRTTVGQRRPGHDGNGQRHRTGVGEQDIADRMRGHLRLHGVLQRCHGDRLRDDRGGRRHRRGRRRDGRGSGRNRLRDSDVRYRRGGGHGRGSGGRQGCGNPHRAHGNRNRRSTHRGCPTHQPPGLTTRTNPRHPRTSGLRTPRTAGLHPHAPNPLSPNVIHTRRLNPLPTLRITGRRTPNPRHAHRANTLHAMRPHTLHTYRASALRTNALRAHRANALHTVSANALRTQRISTLHTVCTDALRTRRISALRTHGLRAQGDGILHAVGIGGLRVHRADCVRANGVRAQCVSAVYAGDGRSACCTVWFGGCGICCGAREVRGGGRARGLCGEGGEVAVVGGGGRSVAEPVAVVVELVADVADDDVELGAAGHPDAVEADVGVERRLRVEEHAEHVAVADAVERVAGVGAVGQAEAVGAQSVHARQIQAAGAGQTEAVPERARRMRVRVERAEPVPALVVGQHMAGRGDVPDRGAGRMRKITGQVEAVVAEAGQARQSETGIAERTERHRPGIAVVGHRRLPRTGRLSPGSTRRDRRRIPVTRRDRVPVPATVERAVRRGQPEATIRRRSPLVRSGRGRSRRSGPAQRRGRHGIRIRIGIGHHRTRRVRLRIVGNQTRDAAGVRLVGGRRGTVGSDQRAAGDIRARPRHPRDAGGDTICGVSRVIARARIVVLDGQVTRHTNSALRCSVSEPNGGVAN